MLIAYGVALRLGPRRGARAHAELATASLLKVLVQPLAAWFVADVALGVHGHALLAIVVTSALPTAQNVFVHATRYQRATVLARDTILVTTVSAVPVIVGRRCSCTDAPPPLARLALCKPARCGSVQTGLMITVRRDIVSDDVRDRTASMTGLGIWRRKPIDEIEAPGEGDGSTQLTRSLGLWQLTAIGVGGIIGAGIFSLAGSVASGSEGGKGVGPAVVFSFLIAGIASAAAALSYAEFAGLIPKAGSAYTYGYAVLGEVVGWAIGWDLLLEYIAIVAVVAIGISGYFQFLLQQLGLSLPDWMLGAPGTGSGHKVDLFAMLLCLLIAWLLTLGMRNAARFETLVVGLKVAVVLLVIGVGVFHLKSATTRRSRRPAGRRLHGAATVFFAVFGYDAMSTAAEESKDAQRHMPKAIIYSLVIAMVLYVLACLTLVGLQNYTEIDPEAGFASAFDSIGLTGIADVIAVGAIIGILTVMFTFMLGVTRVWFAMSRDGLLPRWFAKTHPTRHVPVRVTWLAGVLSAVIAASCRSQRPPS